MYNPRSTLAMVDTVVRLCYAGETGPVAVKLMAQEDSGAHHEHTGVNGRTGGATKNWVDDHSSRGGTSNDDGDVLVAAVEEMTKQQGIKHHGIKVKLEQYFARTKAHRRALATTALTRRWCCRPRGRKAASGVSWRSQATRAGWLGAQGTSRATTALQRLERHYGNGESLPKLVGGNWRK